MIQQIHKVEENEIRCDVCHEVTMYEIYDIFQSKKQSECPKCNENIDEEPTDEVKELCSKCLPKKEEFLDCEHLEFPTDKPPTSIFVKRNHCVYCEKYLGASILNCTDPSSCQVCGFDVDKNVKLRAVCSICRNQSN